MSPLVKWAAVSMASLTVVELALYSRGTLYTDTYRAARTGKAGWIPLAAAGVVFAHLEGWIPPQLDPFSQAGRALLLLHR